MCAASDCCFGSQVCQRSATCRHTPTTDAVKARDAIEFRFASGEFTPAQVEFVVLEQQDVWHHREDGEEDADAAQDGRPRARREAEAASPY